jgi:alpha-ketoglutaric semialdehyde dehydrogenase
LLCGNTVIWKPADYASASARALFDLITRGSGLPAGVLNLVLADGEQTFAGLKQALAEGCLDKIGFTGSSAVGARIGELAGRHLQSPCLELGGKNPMVVTPSADIDLAVSAALFSGFGTAGQRCTSLGTVIVQEDIAEEFTVRLDKAVRSAPVGDPFADVVYGPMLNQRFAERFEEYLTWIEPHHRLLGSAGTGRIRRRPRSGTLLPPGGGGGRARRRHAVRGGDVRPAHRPDYLPGTRRGNQAGQRPRLRPVVVDLHARPGRCLPVPARHLRRHGQRQ